MEMTVKTEAPIDEVSRIKRDVKAAVTWEDLDG